MGWFIGLLILDSIGTALGAVFPILEDTASILVLMTPLVQLAIGIAWGAMCYAAAECMFAPPEPKIRGNWWAAGFVACVILIFVGPVATLGSAWAFLYDPIGTGNDVGSAPCRESDLLSLSNDVGLVADVREVHCLGDWDEPSTYFVFVRPAERAPTRSDLVFRYRGDWEGDRWGRPAKPAWQTNHALLVAVDGKIEQITEQRTEVSGVRIRYAVTAPGCPSTSNPWQRLVWSWLRLFVWC